MHTAHAVAVSGELLLRRVNKIADFLFAVEIKLIFFSFLLLTDFVGFSRCGISFTDSVCEMSFAVLWDAQCALLTGSAAV